MNHEVHQGTPRQEESKIKRPWNALALSAVSFAGLAYVLHLNSQHEAEYNRTHPIPEGARQEFAPTTGKFNLVFEGQKEPKCPGDIEKIVPLKNAEGGFTGLHVMCKPEVTAPAK